MTVSKHPKPYSRKKFTGILSRPMEIPDSYLRRLHDHYPQLLQTLPDNWADTIISRYMAAQVEERLDALFHHYFSGGQSTPSITRPEKSGNWKELVLVKLASDFILGFQRRSKAEAQKLIRQKKAPDYDLILAVKQHVLKGRSARNACDLLGHDKTSKWYGKTQKSVLETYNRSLAAYNKIYKFDFRHNAGFDSWLARQPELTKK